MPAAAKSKPKSVRKRSKHRMSVDYPRDVENVAPAEVSEVSGRRTSAERRRRLSPARFAVARTDDDDAYVNPRLLRLAALGRGEAASRTPGETYANPRLERLKAGRSREAEKETPR